MDQNGRTPEIKGAMNFVMNLAIIFSQVSLMPFHPPLYAT
jgi:hypothetical protein